MIFKNTDWSRTVNLTSVSDKDLLFDHEKHKRHVQFLPYMIELEC